MKNLKFHAISLLFLLVIASCRKDEGIFTSKPAEFYEAQVANDWFDLMRTLTKKSPGFTPPVASRAFGYVGVTLYETVVPGMSKYQSLKGQLTNMPDMPVTDANLEYNWAIASNAALAQAARSFYANMPADMVPLVKQLEDQSLEKLRTGVTIEIVDRSKQYGVAVANAIFEWSKSDGGHEGYLKNFPDSYIPPVGNGKWVPTFPSYQKTLHPFWGKNRTFVPQCAINTQPEAPIPYSDIPTSLFHVQALEVYSVSKNLTAAQKTIAEFWSDDPGIPGTPPGHSVSIATIALKKENANLAKAAETYAKVGMALSDAFVSCWKCKFDHNYIRPISYIRDKFEANWSTILTTPPFPEYTSGHSVQSGAASRVLSDIFGYSFTFIDNTHESRTDIDGRPRTYKSFYEFADEAAISRLYGGIHFREAIDKGVAQGRKVGEEIGKLNFKK
jgi:PAP2 superfamily